MRHITAQDATTPSGRRRAFAVVAGLVLVSMSLLNPVSVAAAGPSDKLPDLRMAKPRDVQLVRYTEGYFAGHRLLRFTTIITNEGTGPLDVRGQRSCTSLTTCPTMTVKQRILQSNGTWRTIPSTMQYDVGDGHKHWHVLGMEKYRLWQLGVADAKPLRAAKYGFCFFDTTRWQEGAGPRHYVARPSGSNPGCGDPKTLQTRVGLTPGWAISTPGISRGSTSTSRACPRASICCACGRTRPIASGRSRLTTTRRGYVSASPAPP